MIETLPRFAYKGPQPRVFNTLGGGEMRDDWDGIYSFLDTAEYYRSLRRDPEETTPERIVAKCGPQNLENKHLGLVGLIEFGYDVSFTQRSLKPVNGKFILTDADAFFDIRVYNATYCYLEVSGCEGCRIKMTPSGNCLTFEDITYENMLFPAVRVAVGRFYTDGDRVEYKAACIDHSHTSKVLKLNSAYAISHFPSLNKVLLLGHIYRSHVVDKNMLERRERI